jgi:hypothetical protein
MQLILTILIVPVCLALVALVWHDTVRRIAKSEEAKVDMAMCLLRHNQVDQKFSEGEKKFDKLIEGIDAVNATLGEIKIAVAVLTAQVPTTVAVNAAVAAVMAKIEQERKDVAM